MMASYATLSDTIEVYVQICRQVNCDLETTGWVFELLLGRAGVRRAENTIQC